MQYNGNFQKDLTDRAFDHVNYGWSHSKTLTIINFFINNSRTPLVVGAAVSIYFEKGGFHAHKF